MCEKKSLNHGAVKTEGLKQAYNRAAVCQNILDRAKSKFIVLNFGFDF